MRRRREKEKREEERRRRREEKNKEGEKKSKGMELVKNFCMNFCMDTCLGVWNSSFCVESLFGMVVWFGYGPQWRKNWYRENVGF